MTPGEAPRKYTTRLFGSLSELATYAEDSPQVIGTSWGKIEWAGGDFASCARRTRDGDLTLVAQSESLLAKFEALTFATPRRQWRYDVAGHVPSVPAYLAGHPTSMRRRARAPSEVAPVTIVVDVFASAAFSHAEILARGAAVLALTRVLAAVRPIELYVGMGSTSRRSGVRGSGFIAARIDTAPLDLAHAAWALCGIGFLRQVLFRALERVYPSDPFPPMQAALGEVAAEMLPHGTHVIAVGGVSSGITRDPGAWIEQRIREAAPEVLGEERAA